MNPKRLSLLPVRFLALLVGVVFSLQCLANQPNGTPTKFIPDQGYLAWRQKLLDCLTPLRLMCIAAHPDDEDSETLAFYRYRYGVRTSILLANWGEGGQNEIGPELYEELGVIRAHETMEASRLVGTGRIYCLNQKDFGFSKSASETWSFWDHDRALEEMVRILRIEKPDVLITNHRFGTGHGNHQAIAGLAVQAIPMAASPECFTGQIRDEGLLPWKVQRFFQQVRHHEGLPGEPFDASVPVGEIDPLRAVAYQEIASEALLRHRSQGVKGIWNQVNQARITQPENFFRSVLDKDFSEPLRDLFEGMKGAWWLESEEPAAAFSKLLPASDTANGPFQYAILDAMKFLGQDSSRFEHALNRAVEILSASPDSSTIKPETLLEIPGEMWGLSLEVHCSEDPLVPAQESIFSLIVHNQGPAMVVVDSFDLAVPTGWLLTPIKQESGSLGPFKQAEAHFLVKPASDALPTQPGVVDLYRSRQPFQPQIRARVMVRKDGNRGAVSLDKRIEIAAPWEIRIEPAVSLVPLPMASSRKKTPPGKNDPSAPFRIEVTRHAAAGTTAELVVQLPDGTQRRTELDPGQARRASTRVEWTPDSKIKPGTYPVKAVLNSQGNSCEAQASVVLADVRVPESLEVGVIQSYDQTLPDSLKALGVDFSLLNEADLLRGDFTRFDAILVDIRGYLERKDLVAANPRLLDYVRQGGRLVVFYHKSFDWNDADPPFAPYPLKLAGSRVTREDAPVTALNPMHPLLRYPNVIEKQDWANWVQERGLYFPDTYDSHYQEIVSMSDPGSEPLKGAILYATYGKGEYIYTSLALYRQLRACVPGGFRLFANLISPKDLVP
ncbi:MAG: PIG-L family deacetylase [Candidatus Omnitrophica bacterium]|nr:PIG-L family deacetylase [Candidatus Omnitrophota bacterium]